MRPRGSLQRTIHELAAKAIELAVPPDLLTRADELIEQDPPVLFCTYKYAGLQLTLATAV